MEPPRLLRLKRELHINDTDSQGKSDVKERLSSAWKALRKVQRQSKHRRELHLEDLAEHYASRRQTTKQNEIKQIKRTRRYGQSQLNISGI